MRAHLSHRCLVGDLRHEMADEIEGLALAGGRRGSHEHWILLVFVLQLIYHTCVWYVKPKRCTGSRRRIGRGVVAGVPGRLPCMRTRPLCPAGAGAWLSRAWNRRNERTIRNWLGCRGQPQPSPCGAGGVGGDVVGGDVARLSRLFGFGISLRNPGCFLLHCPRQAQ